MCSSHLSKELAEVSELEALNARFLKKLEKQLPQQPINKSITERG